MNVIELEYDSVNSNFKKLLGESFNQDLLDAVYDLLPQISAYKEEDKVFGFKIALGSDFKKDVNVETSCFFEIKKYTLKGEKDFENIQRLLKESVIFCLKSADLYIDQISKTEITFGVFFTDYKHTGLLERKILQSNALILEGFVNEGVRVLCNDVEECFFIKLSFSKIFDKHKYSANSFHWSDVCRYWDGIFKKAKQTVHGTICLVVKPDWNLNDDNFIGKKVTEFEGVFIGYSKSESAQDLLKQQYCIEMFLSMLDYDGVTILDTNGKVRSYHNIVKIKGRQKKKESLEPTEANEEIEEEAPGGARHKAFWTLRDTQNWKDRGYIGIYFQTQEGEIEFYSFENGQSQDSFRSEVMNFGADNPQLLDVKSYYDNRYDTVVADWQSCSSDPLFTAIEDLQRIHFEKDNFTNEIVPAQRLENLLTNSWSSIKPTLQNHPGLLRRLLNVLVITYIGNCYGEAWTAIPHIETVIKTIDIDLWKTYFENKDFIYKPLLLEFWGCSENQRTRWEILLELLKSLGIGKPEDFTLDKIRWNFKAFEFLKDFYGREQPGKTINE